MGDAFTLLHVSVGIFKVSMSKASMNPLLSMKERLCREIRPQIIFSLLHFFSLVKQKQLIFVSLSHYFLEKGIGPHLAVFRGPCAGLGIGQLCLRQASYYCIIVLVPLSHVKIPS